MTATISREIFNRLMGLSDGGVAVVSGGFYARERLQHKAMAMDGRQVDWLIFETVNGYWAAEIRWHPETNISSPSPLAEEIEVFPVQVAQRILIFEADPDYERQWR